MYPGRGTYRGGFRCKEMEVTFSSYSSFLQYSYVGLWWKYEGYTQRTHLGYLDHRRCALDLFSLLPRCSTWLRWNMWTAMATATGYDRDHVQRTYRAMGTNHTNYVRHRPAGKGGVCEQEQVATLKPMTPDETSPVRKCAHSTAQSSARLALSPRLIFNLGPPPGTKQDKPHLQTDRALSIPQTRLMISAPNFSSGDDAVLMPQFQFQFQSQPTRARPIRADGMDLAPGPGRNCRLCANGAITGSSPEAAPPQGSWKIRRCPA